MGCERSRADRGGDILVNNDDNNGPILTIDRVTGFPTGFSAGLDRNGLEGAGCELIDDPNGVGTLFVTVNENTGDEVAIYQFERFAGVDESGVSLEQRVDMDAFGRGRILVAPTTTQVSFQLNAPVPAPGLMFLNFGPDVDVCANNAFIGGPFAALTDLFAATPFSNPQGAPLEIPLVANAPLTFPSTPFQSITTLSNFRAQAVVALPGIPFGFLPVVPTNEIRFDVNPNIIGITGIAEGRDTFTPEPNGFWRFTNPSTDPNKAIVELSIDLSTSTTASGQFDVDGLTGALGDFDHGNGTVGTCLNSYLGSDVSVGLIYDSQNAVSGCDPAAFTGWDGLQAATTVGNWNSVRFRFMPGMFGGGATFAFNADTDADTSSSPGTGINGASKDGVTVTVTFADGTQSVGVFVADPSAAVSTSRVTL